MNELEKAREIINSVDKEMAELFEKRMEASKEVAKFKKEHSLSILDTSRENEVIARNSEYIKDGIIREYYVNFLKDTMAFSRAYQSRLNEGMKVAYSGVTGAFAYIAAKEMFPEAILVPFKSFEDAYTSVENGECDTAVLPIENSFAGDVGDVMDLIFSGSLFINQVIDLPVRQNLIAVEGANKGDIKEIVSHPQALAQCAKYIKKLGCEVKEFANTALAAKYVKELGRKDVAAIASTETAKIYGLEVLEKNVNESKNNTTRFAAFSRAQNESKNTDNKVNKCFILVFTVKNEAGALAKTLDIIGVHGFNMKSLRSRPMKNLLWNYYFFMEAEGDINSKDGKDMVKELGATCAGLKVAGTYISRTKEV